MALGHNEQTAGHRAVAALVIAAGACHQAAISGSVDSGSALWIELCAAARAAERAHERILTAAPWLSVGTDAEIAGGSS
jgi:hypothetical protein